MASLSPLFRMCSGGRIRLFISSRYLGTCGLNSTALWMASTAFISAVLSPRLDAASGENLSDTALALSNAAV